MQYGACPRARPRIRTRNTHQRPARSSRQFKHYKGLYNEAIVARVLEYLDALHPHAPAVVAPEPSPDLSVSERAVASAAEPLASF